MASRPRDGDRYSVTSRLVRRPACNGRVDARGVTCMSDVGTSPYGVSLVSTGPDEMVRKGVVGHDKRPPKWGGQVRQWAPYKLESERRRTNTDPNKYGGHRNKYGPKPCWHTYSL